MSGFGPAPGRVRLPAIIAVMVVIFAVVVGIVTYALLRFPRSAVEPALHTGPVLPKFRATRVRVSKRKAGRRFPNS